MNSKLNNETERLSALVSEQLQKTFEGIAKLALQGASEAGDENLSIIDRARKAHSRVTLIIDDAMRGLGQVNESMFLGAMTFGAIIGASAPDDEQSGELDANH